MYSRFKGAPAFPSGGHREPSYRQTMRIPPNYQGTAIGASPPDGVPPATDGVSISSMGEGTVVREEAVSHGSEPREMIPVAVTEAEQDNGEKAKSFSPLGGLLSAEHFPFGHGLGYEELLLLGLIVFLLHEGKEDGSENDLSMTVLLLGALLFLG